MDVEPQIKKAIFLAWILIVPAGMWFTYINFPPNLSNNWLDILTFFILTTIVAAMPMVINNTTIFLIQWISLATFLNFGLFVEMALAQIAVITLLLRVRVQKVHIFRFPMNSIMFFIVSLVSGIIYYLLGGKTGTHLGVEHLSLVFSVVYLIINFTLNQIFIGFIYYGIYKSKEPFFGKDFIWETVTTFVTFPLGFVLYILHSQIGILASLFVGIPFASLSIILNLYYSSENINELLQKASEIGHQMAERLFVNDVTDLFIQELTKMLPVDYAYILNVIDNKELHVIRRIEKGKVMSNDLVPIRKNEGLSGMVWASKKAAFFKKKKEWIKIISGYFPVDAESVLSVPIVKSNEVVGVLFLASRRKRAYEKSHLMLVDILCSHYAVATENARHYEETKMYSEHCALTNLYNYRFFENILSSEFKKLHKLERKKISLIILDLDHFKAINDTYGHQGGNEILKELANRLSLLIGNKGTVARYGGEEFVVLLSDIEKKEAFQIAELIRQTIANRSFTLNQHMEESRGQMQVMVTASIGVATAPEDAEDSLALIRHADRALYVGAKRAGRNRVAEYVKLVI